MYTLEIQDSQWQITTLSNKFCQPSYLAEVDDKQLLFTCGKHYHTRSLVHGQFTCQTAAVDFIQANNDQTCLTIFITTTERNSMKDKNFQITPFTQFATWICCPNLPRTVDYKMQSFLYSFSPFPLRRTLPNLLKRGWWSWVLRAAIARPYEFYRNHGLHTNNVDHWQQHRQAR